MAVRYDATDCDVPLMRTVVQMRDLYRDDGVCCESQRWRGVCDCYSRIDLMADTRIGPARITHVNAWGPDGHVLLTLANQ